MTIGENINLILIEKNKTQYRLSKESGVSKSYISELIRGKYTNPSMKKVSAIAEALEVPIYRLLDTEL